MEYAGAAFPITPLLSTCTKIVTILHNVGKKFKRAPLMMTSIATECSLIHVALAQLRNFDWTSVSAYADGRQEQMTRATESIILGCTLTLSVIEEYAIELQDYVDGSPLSPTEQMGIMARVRVLWKEEEMRELLLQLRGYQTGLTGLIRAAHDSDFSDSHDALSTPGSNFGTLLQRSRSSRSRKPLSIRAAMSQAATYSNISRSVTSNYSKPSGHSNHSSNPSTSTTQSRQSTIASSTSAAPTSASSVGSIQTLSPGTAELFDSAAHATSSHKPFSDSGRRKRPAFLALQPEESNTVVDGQTIHTKRDKDQLRKSSPTVGENFTFVPGEPPLEDLPPPPKGLNLPIRSKKVEKVAHQERPASPTLPLQPLQAEPPTGPLPKPPSRSPSRSRSPGPPNIPVRAPSRSEPSRAGSRAGSRAESRAGSHAGRVDIETASPSPPQQVAPLNEQLEDPHMAQVQEEEEEQQVERESEEDIDEIFQPPSPPEEESPVSAPPSAGLPQMRKQKSSSSVRSQIIALPETARLRKEASAEALRKQPSSERLYPRTPDEPVPALPMTGAVGYVRGNAFGKQGSHSSLHASRSPPPRSSSIEALSDIKRKRSATDLSQHAGSNDSYSLPLRPKRGISRSASEARRPPNLRFPLPQTADDRDSPSPISASLGSPLSQAPTSAQSETWPLTPELGHTSDCNHGRNYQQHYLQPGEHSRNTSSERSLTPSAARTLSPDQTPRASRSTTPYSGTPRTGRSRTNTLMTITSEGVERELVDDGMSTAGSVAPSVMSAQWFRTPRERLGLGTRVSRAEILPWESGADEEARPPVPPKPKTPPSRSSRMGTGVANMFSVFPPRAPSRSKEGHQINETPPRSPLLTEQFLSDVKTTLPKDRAPKEAEQPPRPSTSMMSREGAKTPEWARKPPKKEKPKKKKESRFPTLTDMVKEYKNMGNSWYTSAYAQAAEEQRIEKEIREGKRPATGSTSSSRLGATTSLEEPIHVLSPTSTQFSGHHGRGDIPKSLRTVPSSITPRPSGESSQGSSETGKIGEKDEKRKRKKSGSFPTMKELWGEYKTSANHWYTAPYQEEETRNVATPQSHFS